MEMSLRTDRALLRATANSTRYLRINLTAPVAPTRVERPPVQVGIVLDRSGSMEGERKFTLALQAVEQALALLQPHDRFTLVVYDTDVDRIMASTPATPDAKRIAMQRLREVAPRGGTDLYAGWMTAASEMLAHLAADSVNRVLLITDGLANAGITESPALIAASAELRRRGVGTTTFGVGDDFDEVLLRDIAHDGGGHAYFIATPDQIGDLLTSELGDALEITLRSAVLQIALPPGATGALLNRYRTTHVSGDNELHVHLGDLTSGQEQTLVLKLTFAQDREGARTNVRVRMSAAEALHIQSEMLNAASGASELEQELWWTYDTHRANDAQPRDREVDRDVAQLYASLARAEATDANRQGDLPRAKRVLERTARRIREYAFDDDELNALWRTLLAEVEQYALRAMSGRERKERFYAAESMLNNRDALGKARRQNR
jgi:Mg-chelatase subunit ChlD